MSTRRHCDVCNKVMSILDSYVTIQPGGLAGAIADLLVTDDIEMCSTCWTATVKYVRARKADR